ncbi:telomeric repeat-binding factor 2-interacting protein 1-like [Biomphalaria glabrata]|uniref:Telomeric repeat-binding factor 2-interacting protein 1 n=1 Tax=Biomphalaria glabrata TaxID=6526 RepID=A0A9U8EET7_BIOGL|nr:telomeric repeat-binding factor 2-interacting protein 1-like [Biomphalaria glabrata]
MAANLKSMLNFNFSVILFRNYEDFSPKIFFVKTQDDELSSLIEKGGGYITDNASEADVLLCETRNDPLINNGYLPFSFITDCIVKNRFIHTDNYRAEVLGLNPSTSKDINVSDNTGDENVLGPVESTRVKLSQDDFTGRKKYTLSDDLNIIKYLINNDVYTKTGGNVVWKQMESLQVTQHTYQSMKARFKLILNHIDNYDIPDDWKAKLNGLEGVKSKKCETSGESSDEDPLFDVIDKWNHKEADLKNKTKKRKMSKNSVDVQVESSDDDLASFTGSESSTGGSSTDSVSSLRLSMDGEIQQDVLPSFGSISPVSVLPGSQDKHDYDSMSDESISPVITQDQRKKSGLILPIKMPDGHGNQQRESSSSETISHVKLLEGQSKQQLESPHSQSVSLDIAQDMEKQTEISGSAVEISHGPKSHHCGSHTLRIESSFSTTSSEQETEAQDDGTCSPILDYISEGLCPCRPTLHTQDKSQVSEANVTLQLVENESPQFEIDELSQLAAVVTDEMSQDVNKSPELIAEEVSHSESDKSTQSETDENSQIASKEPSVRDKTSQVAVDDSSQSETEESLHDIDEVLPQIDINSSDLVADEATLLRRVEFLTKHLRLTRLEALYLLKALHGDFIAALAYLNDP